jgi:phage terminase small subunit
MAKAQTDGTTEQQKLFVYAYFNNGGNASQAAITAGYAKNSAPQTASRLLTYDNVKALLKELQDTVKQKAIVTKEEIAAEMAKIAFSDVRKLFDSNSRLLEIKDIPDDIAGALSSVEVDQLWGATLDGREQIGDTKKVKVWDKMKALQGLTDLYGYNAPAKVAQTDTKGDDIPQDTTLSDKQFEQLLNKINAPNDAG